MAYRDYLRWEDSCSIALGRPIASRGRVVRAERDRGVDYAVAERPGIGLAALSVSVAP